MFFFLTLMRRIVANKPINGTTASVIDENKWMRKTEDMEGAWTSRFLETDFICAMANSMMAGVNIQPMKKKIAVKTMLVMMIFFRVMLQITFLRELKALELFSGNTNFKTFIRCFNFFLLIGG